MTTPLPPETPPRRRPRRRLALIGATALAVLIVGGVAAALLIPRAARADDGYRVGPAASSEQYDGRGGPGRGGRDGEGGRGGGLGRLGNDAVLPGTVVSVATGSLVVTPDGAAQRTIRTDDNTRVRGESRAALTDLKPGDRVVVRVTGAGDAATARAVTVVPARVTGTVTALTGDVATVVGVDGLRVTVNVAGLTQKPAVGDVVEIAGTAADGTTITATRIRVLPKAS